jgi:hypothetical protein
MKIQDFKCSLFTAGYCIVRDIDAPGRRVTHLLKALHTLRKAEKEKDREPLVSGYPEWALNGKVY